MSGRDDSAPPNGEATSCSMVRFARGGPASAEDRVAVEEPLEIRVSGEPLAVTMRTPGHDPELTAGFLFAEGLVERASEFGKIVHCGRPGEEGFGNVVDVTPAPGVAFDAARLAPFRRGTLATAACGVCGRRSIDDLLARCLPLSDDSRFPARLIAELPAALRERQVSFSETGGLHGAAVATADGELLCTREDVGRHNAVDKVVGRLFLDRVLPSPGKVLVVTGRVSFEIVQKAIAARIALVIGVSAPSSLAVETARRARVTLVAFARGATFNVYTESARVLH
jgi:FdhD protein